MTNDVRTAIISELQDLRRFAWSLTGIKEDAEDLVQAVVERLLQKGIPADANPRHWMLRVCKNLWVDEIRHRDVKRRSMQDPQWQDLQSTDGEIQVSASIDAQRVRQAMQLLSENQRIALSLVSIEGLSYQEAAAVIDAPIGTVMSRIARARENLLRHLKSGNKLETRQVSL